MALEAVKQVYQHLGEGDLESIVGLCDEEVEWVVNGASTIEVTGAFAGVEGVRSFLASVDKAWMLRFSAPREFIDAGDKIVVLGEGAGKERASGEQFRSRWVHVFTMRNGRIMSFRQFICQWLGDDAPPPMSWQ